MLTELRIRNFALIEEAALTFGSGLNVLSGETGAGKTIIMTALGLLLGGRASPELIRAGAREAVVEGIFELEGELQLPEAAEWLRADNPRQLLVRRVIAEAGRSRVLINDNLATVQALARLGAAFVQIYGQHEQQSLMQREHHLAMLDRHAGLEAELAAYRSLYERAHALRAELTELERRDHERNQLLELARWRLAELERAGLRSGEDDELSAERTVLANATRLAEAASTAEQALYGAEGAAIDLVAQAQGRLGDAVLLDPQLGGAVDLIAAARANLEEAARELAIYAARVEADPIRLEQVEARLQELTKIKRKHGGTLASALETLERSRVEIVELEAARQTHAAVEAELTSIHGQLLQSAQRLSAQRQEHALELKHQMEAELKSLGMRNPEFEARVGRLEPGEGEFVEGAFAAGPAGMDTVEFYLAPNLGQPPMALQRAASGGELSRVMLALKRLEAQRRGVATLIFDEVDAGIGGAAGEIVGRKLKQLARFHQILCVTHLAQIAVFADSHFAVEKEERRGATRSRVSMLEPAERAEEIVRMMGGAEGSERFMRAARELVSRARQ